MNALPIVFGLLIGFALGLTGGGGSIFAVPLLVYGLAMEPRQAVGVSLAAVGATALVGSLHRLHSREVEVGIGLVFSLGGLVGAPLGAWIGNLLPSAVLLVLFAGLMLVIAVRMWSQSARKQAGAPAVPTSCRHDAEGRLCWSWNCAGVLTAAGLLTGILAGMFGVGGGFVIVPALVFVTGMGIHRAVATSLMTIALISAAGVASYFLEGRSLPLDVTTLFVLGGVVGLLAGSLLARRLHGPHLQKTFAAAIVGVAAFMLIKTLA